MTTEPPQVDYASPPKGDRLRRWLRRLVLFVLILFLLYALLALVGVVLFRMGALDFMNQK